MGFNNKVLLPPEVEETGDSKVLFIAGPIQGATDWQSEAIKQIHGLDNCIVVANPRKEYAEGEFDYVSQVDWEKANLQKAANSGAIVFWLAGQSDHGPKDERGFYRSYAQTTRFELAEWLTKAQFIEGVKIVVGIDADFGNARYIRRRISQDTPNVPITDSLESTIETAVKLIS